MSIEALIAAVLECKALPEDIVKMICRKVKALLFEQSNVQPVQAPVTICGDVHGQFWDVLEMFARGGDVSTQRYVLLGDYVDRGYNSVETMLLLFLFKLKNSDRMVLLRGNHESRNISYMYGFYQEIGRKYGNYNVWYYFNEAFDLLPIAAIIEGKIFCVHGGLSPRRNTIDYIRAIDRNAEIPSFGPLCDLMWSDPEQDIETWKKNSRGAGWLFGKKAVEEFLNVNGVDMIVRSHQLVQEGFKEHFQKKVLTVWSAPNYCYRMNNKAAIMKVGIDLQPSYITYEASEKNSLNVNYENLMPYFL